MKNIKGMSAKKLGMIAYCLLCLLSFLMVEDKLIFLLTLLFGWVIPIVGALVDTWM